MKVATESPRGLFAARLRAIRESLLGTSADSGTLRLEGAASNKMSPGHLVVEPRGSNETREKAKTKTPPLRWRLVLATPRGYEVSKPTNLGRPEVVI